MRRITWILALLLSAGVLVAAGCGDDEDVGGGGGAAATPEATEEPADTGGGGEAFGGRFRRREADRPHPEPGPDQAQDPVDLPLVAVLGVAAVHQVEP